MARLVAEVDLTGAPRGAHRQHRGLPVIELDRHLRWGEGDVGAGSSAAGSALSEPPLAAESASALWVSAWRVRAASSSSARSLLSLRTAVRKLRYASTGVSSGER